MYVCMYVCLFGKLSLRRATSGETLVEAASVTDTTPPQPTNQPHNHTSTKATSDNEPTNNEHTDN